MTGTVPMTETAIAVLFGVAVLLIWTCVICCTGGQQPAATPLPRVKGAKPVERTLQAGETC